ncbi:uncharacterized protein LOC130979314 [Arachis stenosperma]|uniref:uncharacterized protein LOC130979314 n=1 Tax=Arachis stenosperma TaxID=217475 RepID=UPI0025AC4935|nr:uncharacterized protein LOC130979314 [Arachis stenosperma]
MSVVAGLAADGRQIVVRTKSEATNYDSVYGEPILVKELTEHVASYVHLCTLPFGCGIILGGYDRDGPQLYMVEPSAISYVKDDHGKHFCCMDHLEQFTWVEVTRTPLSAYDATEILKPNDKVQANSDQDVWNQLKAGSFQFNEEMMESLFGYNAAQEKSKPGMKKESREQTPQYIQIIEPKKAKNLSNNEPFNL